MYHLECLYFSVGGTEVVEAEQLAQSLVVWKNKNIMKNSVIRSDKYCGSIYRNNLPVPNSYFFGTGHCQIKKLIKYLRIKYLFVYVLYVFYILWRTLNPSELARCCGPIRKFRDSLTCIGFQVTCLPLSALPGLRSDISTVRFLQRTYHRSYR